MKRAKVRLGFTLDDMAGNEYPFVEIDDNNPRHATVISQPHLAPGVSAGDVLLLTDEPPKLTQVLARNEDDEVVEAGTMPLYEVEAIVSKCGRTSILIAPSEAVRDNPISLMSFQSEVKAAAKAIFQDAPDQYSLNFQMVCFILTTAPERAGLNHVLATLKVFETIKSVEECEVMDLGEKDANDDLNITPYPYVKPH